MKKCNPLAHDHVQVKQHFQGFHPNEYALYSGPGVENTTTKPKEANFRKHNISEKKGKLIEKAMFQRTHNF